MASREFDIYYAGVGKVHSPRVSRGTLTVTIRIDNAPRWQMDMPSSPGDGILCRAKVRGKHVFHLWHLGGAFGWEARSELEKASQDIVQPTYQRLALATLEEELEKGGEDHNIYAVRVSCEMKEPSHPLFALALKESEVTLGMYRADPALPVDETPTEVQQDLFRKPEPQVDENGVILEATDAASLREVADEVNAASILTPEQLATLREAEAHDNALEAAEEDPVYDDDGNLLHDDSCNCGEDTCVCVQDEQAGPPASVHPSNFDDDTLAEPCAVRGESHGPSTPCETEHEDPRPGSYEPPPKAEPAADMITRSTRARRRR